MSTVTSVANVQTNEFEQQRLAALRRTELLDTAREPEFDELVEIAAAICGAPMSLVSLVDESRQWFKAATGLDETETAREISFCTHTIQQDDLFTVEDATKDPRFSANPMVTGEFNLRFYAGFPLSSPDGYHVGSLCVLDRIPHHLNSAQESGLKALARQVNALIELRMRRRQLEKALESAREGQARLEASDRRFKAFMDSGPFLSFLKNTDGHLLFYNQQFANRFQIGPRDWLGKRYEDIYEPGFANQSRTHDLEVLHTRKVGVFLEPMLEKQGTTTIWRSYRFPCPSSDGSMILGGILLDVTEELQRAQDLENSRNNLEAANRMLSDLAATDPLTGIANRRRFEERLDLEFARARRKKTPLAVLMLDVDNFKLRNDTYGHSHGDDVLRTLARCLTKAVREVDLAARYGGEEFVILLPECTEPDALLMAERINQCIRETPWENGPITVSIGAAALDDATPNPLRLVILADEALYAAKRAGKNRFVSYHAYYQELLAKLQAENQPSATP